MRDVSTPLDMTGDECAPGGWKAAAAERGARKLTKIPWTLPEPQLAYNPSDFLAGTLEVKRDQTA